MKRLFLVVLMLCLGTIVFAATIPNIICFQLSSESSPQIHRDAKGWVNVQTGINQFDRLMNEYGIPTLEPQFSFDPTSLSNPTFFELGMDRFYLIRLPNKMDEKVSQELLSKLSQLPHIESAWFAEYHYPMLTPNDWGLSGRDMWFLDAINARQAWDIQLGSPNILAVTIDTGVDFYHPDLVQNIAINPAEDINGNGQFDQDDLNGVDNDGNGFVDDVVGYDFVSISLGTGQYPAVGEDYGPRDPIPSDVQGHGTHVAGSIAARTNNGIGVPSASFNVKTLVVRAGCGWLDEPGGTTTSGGGADVDFIPAIQYSVNRGARIVSISFGGTDTNPAYQTAVNYARSNNCLVLAAAGNENVSTPSFPAAYSGVVAVAALNRGYVKAAFSNYGSWVDISAPGVDIWSTMVVNTYNPASYVAWPGTSMACPTVAAVGALVLSRFPSYTDDQLEARLISTAININGQNPGYNGMLGAGCVNAAAAVGVVSVPVTRISESFEGSFPPTNWVLQPATGSGAWVRSNGTPYGPGSASHGTYCAMFNAYDFASGVTGSLITPQFTLQNISSPQLTFEWYNYDEFLTIDADLEVWGTMNNGTNWDFLTEFLAQDHNWYSATVDLSDYLGAANVRVAFRVVSDYGYYNIFVDNVRVTGTTDVEETTQNQLPNQFDLISIYPNPFNPSTTISFHLPHVSDVSIAVYDLQGREVYQSSETKLSVGSHSRSITLANKPSGTYFVQLRAGEQAIVRKMVLLK